MNPGEQIARPDLRRGRRKRRPSAARFPFPLNLSRSLCLRAFVAKTSGVGLARRSPLLARRRSSNRRILAALGRLLSAVSGFAFGGRVLAGLFRSAPPAGDAGNSFRGVDTRGESA